MREADDAALARAEVWVDSLAAIHEAGDLSGPITRGMLKVEDIRGTLRDLCAIGAVDNRDELITLFKSVGDAVQDLAAAAIALD
jgi:ornithine cyclodeaminase